MTLPSPSRLAVYERQQFGRIRAETVRRLLALWASIERIDDRTFEQWFAPALVLHQAALDAVERTANGYLDAWGQANGLQVGEATGITVGRPASLEQTLRRPYVTTWTALARGTAPQIARQQGAQRARQIFETDLQIARRETLNRRIAQSGERIVGYRRVLGPGENCGLCIVASTQRYHRDDLMPIHSSCGCGIEPLIGTRTPPRVLDRDLLKATRTALDGDPYTRSNLSRLRLDPEDLPTVEVRHHGELGPVLTDSRHQHTSPSDLAA